MIKYGLLSVSFPCSGGRRLLGRPGSITVIELLALCTALDIAPVDLLVPAYLENESYRVAPKASAAAVTVREWIRGEQLLYWSIDPEPGAKFVSPDTPGESTAFVQFMPEDRKRRVLQRWLDEEKRDQWDIEHEEELHEQWLAEQQQKREQRIAEQDQKRTES